MLEALALVLLGLLVGVVGTATHRWAPPLGLTLGLSAVLSAAVFARALLGGVGLALFGGALVLLVQLAASLLPGGDVLIVADARGFSWLVLPILLVAAVAFLPRRWFDRSGHRERPRA